MPHILVIEDDPQHCLMLRNALEDDGYTITEAANGRIGCDLYAKHPADAVIVDIFMPEKEGLETIVDLKAGTPDSKIIAISGGSALRFGGPSQVEEVLKVAKLAGANYTFAKPFKIQELLAVLRDLLTPR